MTPQYILRKSLCRAPFCATETDWQRTALNEIDNLRYAQAYAEPGYDNPKKGILFANWNYFSKKVGDLLERYGFEIEWSDEWDLCDDCYKAVRTVPDSWSWEPNYVMSQDGETICKACNADNPVEVDAD